MGQERLCGLALLHIRKDKVDSTEGFNERVLKRWDATGHRKIGKLWNKEQENSEWKLCYIRRELNLTFG